MPMTVLVCDMNTVIVLSGYVCCGSGVALFFYINLCANSIDWSSAETISCGNTNVYLTVLYGWAMYATFNYTTKYTSLGTSHSTRAFKHPPHAVWCLLI